MKIRLITLVVAIAMMGGSAKAAESDQAAAITDDVVKIGLMTAMTGPLSTITGEGSVAGARMAIEDFGGTVLGKPIKLLTGNSQSDPSIASTLARKWIDQENVDMIIGLPTSSVATAIQSLASSKNTMTIAIGAATAALTNKHCAPLSIHYTYDTYAFASGAARAIMKSGRKKWFFIGTDYIFGHTLVDTTSEIVEQLGGEVVGTVYHPLNTHDFASYLLKANASDADVVALANSGVDFVNVINQAREFGVDKNKQIVGLYVVLQSAKSVGLEALQGLRFVSAWYWNMNENTRAFTERYKQRTGTVPNMAGAGMYSAVTTYLKAVEAAGTDKDKTVRAQLAQMTISDMFMQDGWVRSDGRVMHDMYLMEVKTPTESDDEWDLFKNIGTIPAKQAFMPLSQSQCDYITEQSSNGATRE